MKKWFMLAMIVMVMSIGIVTAQDSTAVNIVNDILPSVESRYPIVTIVLSVLWGISELLSLIPSIKANGIFQLIFGVIAKANGK